MHIAHGSTRGIALAAALTLTLTACGGPSAPPPPTDAAITLENCNRTVELEKPAERVVSLNQGTTETLLRLGKADHMVGTAGWTDPIHPDLTEANDRVPRLGDFDVSLETVLTTEPDLVVSSFTYGLSEASAGPLEAYDKVGVATYIVHTECLKTVSADGGEDTAREKKLTLEDIYTDIRELATLTGDPDAGTALVESLEEQRQAIHKPDHPASVAFWYANGESPFIAGGRGAPQIIADELGIENVFADQQDEWPQVGWEAVAQADPDYLVIGDLTRDNQTAESAKAKIEVLKSNPITKEMDAVKHDRFIIVTGSELDPTSRTIDAMEKVAAAL